MQVRLSASVLFVMLLGSAWGLTFQDETELERVWTCPVHREVTEAEAGECPVCERQLVQTLVRERWSCPIHSVVSEPGPGKCPICSRDLFPMSEEVAYACPMHPEVREVAPGKCPICNMALEPSTSSRPHQNHNPQHGGMFFMAPDNWHHLEGTYVGEGVFRVYLYNNFSEPLSASGFEARAVVEEVFDKASKTTREIEAYPLVASEDGSYLEAHVSDRALPREITAKIRFDSGGGFERFDFVFADVSRDVAGDVPEPGAPSDFSVPESPDAIARAISERNARVGELVRSGAFAEIYVPALEAKNLAVALLDHVSSAPVGRRRALEWAVKQLVRSAWLLDDYGDLGNRQKVQAAYGLFDEAVEELVAIYE